MSGGLDSYTGAPADGSAVGGLGARVMRGNSFHSSDDGYLRTDFRSYIHPSGSIYVGFRLAR